MSKLLEKYQIVIDAAIEASAAILEIYHTDFEKEIKADGSPVTAADIASSKIIRKYLAQTDIPITGEEQDKVSYEERKNWKLSWCIDPLDGTKDFVRKNNEFVINIALIENTHPKFGLIASPIKQEIIIGTKEEGAFQFSYNDAQFSDRWRRLPMLSPPQKPIGIISSRSEYTGEMLRLVKWIEIQYGAYKGTNMGSALKFFELVNQKAAVYPRFARTMEWDIAAGQAIYEAIGGKIVEKRTGIPLTYNKENLENPDFIAYNPAITLF